MKERLREFDPSGTLQHDCAEIAALIARDNDKVCDAFFETYLAHTNLQSRLSPETLGKIRDETRRYIHLKFTDPTSEAWAESARGCLHHARRHGGTIRSVLVAISAGNERIADLVDENFKDDDVRRLSLQRALLRLSMVEAELLCSDLAAQTAQDDQSARKRSGEIFQKRIVGEIDSASRLGEGLREQAKDASAATRGMLGKASEVAAAAEQSALAMREAAHTSAGLIRAIEDARTEVEGAADVAARASSQAGEAVSMSVTLSDDAKSIESILGLIRDIAGQTNLLALNATIEAARAGDAGRGFAVVAQEVKSLANQTARATDDIAGKIGAIQASTRQSVETNQRIQETVDEVQRSAERIRSAMDVQAQTVTMITAAVDETALAADSMSATISAIRQDTEVVASEIDQLERGFMSVEGKLSSLRDSSNEMMARVA
jgi:methyl-accepting chemotaxis protein